MTRGEHSPAGHPGQPAHPAQVPQRVLVVDDEDIVIRSTVRILEGAGLVLTTAHDAAQALRELAQAPFDLAILDIMMPGMDGIELLQRIKESYPDTEVIMFTGLAQVATAVSCMKLGAIDYVSKPFDPDELRLAVTRALEQRALRRENESLKETTDARYRLDRMVGQSPAMQQLYRLIAQCAATNSTVLLTGESGTGKELAARAIHHNSLRSGGPFVAVDCSSLSEQLLESELFGHARGAFSGAVSRKKGMVEVAEGGTLFLDEIGNIPLAVQSKLLRLIQTREFRAVGDTQVQTANFRLVAATNKDLAAMAADGSFAADLYYRLAVFPIHLPPLRERRERHSRSGAALPAWLRPRTEEGRRRHLRKRHERAGGARLARQRPPARERIAPRGDPVFRQGPAYRPPGRRRRHQGHTRRATHRRGAQAAQEDAARKVGRGPGASVRAGSTQAQRLERDPQRPGRSHAAGQFPGADAQARRARARHIRAWRRSGRHRRDAARGRLRLTARW
jgi:CheY-like chemotaxis protein